MNIENILENFIKDLPKVELHVHFEAMITSDIVKKMGGSIDNKSQPFNIFEQLLRLLCSDFKTNTEILLESIFNDRYDNNILYTQFQYSALKIQSLRGVKINIKEQFDILIEHITKIKKDHKFNNIYIDFILDIPRGNADNYVYFSSGDYVKDIIKLSKDDKYKYYIRGLGIGGRDETNTIDNMYKSHFDKIKKEKLAIIPHAGEFCSNKQTCDSINSALNYSSRIGHGVRILGCNDISKKPSDIVLDISITSNLTFIPNSDGCLDDPIIKKYKDIKDHPIKDLIKKGYQITLSTDDPGV
jgi:adenosine deaminase